MNSDDTKTSIILDTVDEGRADTDTSPAEGCFLDSSMSLPTRALLSSSAHRGILPPGSSSRSCSPFTGKVVCRSGSR